MEKFTFFWRGPFSQWYPSPFFIDRVRYSCAEQYMMAEKARLFEDQERLEMILSTANPRDQKRYGRMVTPFDNDKWNQIARDVVFRGNLAKFRQNAELGDILADTAGTTLVEASPVDCIWGIGLSEDDPKARDRGTWRGANWLGEVLTKVREDLIRKRVIPSSAIHPLTE